MKKMLVVTYNGFIDSIKGAAEALEDRGYVMCSYPLFKYIQDETCGITDVKKHMKEFVVQEKPHIILWWYARVGATYFEAVYKDLIPRPYTIFFNWDDPWVWVGSSKEEKEEWKKKCKYFDLVACSSNDTQKYIENGAKKAVRCLPGFDTALFSPQKNRTYTCDISFCCTNLYEDKNVYNDQIYNRKDVVDAVYREHLSGGFVFHIYGPLHLKKLYPLSYRGEAQYKDLNKVFTHSRINLCTHVCSGYDGYINERVILILASGGLLLSDLPKGFGNTVHTREECVILKRNYIKQIYEIIEKDRSCDRYEKMRLKGFERSKLYTWDDWAEIILTDVYENVTKMIGKRRINDDLSKHLLKVVNGDWDALLDAKDTVTNVTDELVFFDDL